ncbi:hypothetical protein Goshw_010624 [Gossypium schwendimanii]|uniref:Uncharacterized protein n=2 Tax=Gossypium TaxID=3633 RepID=A0A7J9L8X4_GOSSC|nr:hypothetical protein [Gossypium trilobum]MBA0855205.1 hypothetical protein [Gossypium schwendimanii]
MKPSLNRFSRSQRNLFEGFQMMFSTMMRI